MTVFLTTQYLEEADVLADRVGIIDHGHIVAEGTPDGAEGRDRPADRRGRCPPTRPTRERANAILGGFGDAVRVDARRRRPARAGEADLAGHRARARRRGHRGRAPAAAPADARRRLPREDRPLARGRRRRRRGGAGVGGLAMERGAELTSATLDQVYLLGRRSVVRTLRQPANVDRAARLPADAAGRQLRRPAARRRTCRASRRTRSWRSCSPCRSSRARCSRR